MPFTKKVTETNRRRYTGQQKPTRSARRHIDKTANKQQVTWSFRSSVGLNKILFCLCLRRDVQNSCLQCAGGPEGRLASKKTRMWASFSAQGHTAPLSALRHAEPTRLLFVRVLDLTGPQSVDIGFCLSVLLWRCSSDVASMLWRVREKIVPQVDTSACIQFCSTALRHRAVRPDATQLWYVLVLDKAGRY